MRILYIASPSFSGSTLVTLSLVHHPQIATVGELKGGQEDVTTYLCSCGVLFKECEYWRSINDYLGAAGFNFDLADRSTMPVYHQSGSSLLDRIAAARFRGDAFEYGRKVALNVIPGAKSYIETQNRYNNQIIEHILQKKNASVFLDSSKDPIRIKYLAENPQMEVYVVQLVRDGRAVTNSAVKKGLQSVEAAAREWDSTHREIEGLVDHYGSRLQHRVLRYEDYCHQPNREAMAIFRWIGLGEFEIPDMVDGSAQHVMGNSMRLKGEQIINYDATWESELSSADIAVFDKIAGKKNSKFGNS